MRRADCMAAVEPEFEITLSSESGMVTSDYAGPFTRQGRA